MKKYLVFIWIILVVSSCMTNRVNFDELQNRDGLFYLVNENEPFTGDIESFNAGTKQFEGSVKNGLKDDLWIYYYPNGQKKAEGIYKDGLKEETWTYWAENGEKADHEVYKMGTKLGNDESVRVKVKSDDGSEGTITIEGDDGSGGSITIKVNEDKKSTTVKKKSTEPKAVRWEHLDGGPVKYYRGKPYTGPVIKYYKEGDKGKYIYGHFTNGHRSGKWTYYHRDGRVKDVKYY